MMATVQKKSQRFLEARYYVVINGHNNTSRVVCSGSTGYDIIDANNRLYKAFGITQPKIHVTFDLQGHLLSF